MRGSIAPQSRLLAENRSVGTLGIAQGTPMQIWPGKAAVLAKQKNGAPPVPYHVYEEHVHDKHDY